MIDRLSFTEYPRPHLKRQNWFNLNGLWSFKITSLDEPNTKPYDRFINVPFPVESNLSGIQERIDSTMLLWYKREFRLQFSSKERVLLHFDKVDYETMVYINDQFIGSKHLGGYDPFSCDITSYINSNSNNRIIVRVWDPSDHWYQADVRCQKCQFDFLYTLFGNLGNSLDGKSAIGSN